MAFFRTIRSDLNFQIKNPADLQKKTKYVSQSSRKNVLDRIRQTVPATTGVYLFKAKHNQVIYVGKSVNLKSRMAAYFYRRADNAERRILQMTRNIRDFSFIETDTELLALLLEDALIKKHLPEYNIKQKEFNEYTYLLLTDDAFPTLKILQHHNNENHTGHIFGPFKDQYFVNDILDIIYQHLHMRQCQEKIPIRNSINYELGICTGPCRQKISVEAYEIISTRVEKFLSGNADFLLDKLQQKMQEHAQSLEFEKAAQIKKQLEFCSYFSARQKFFHQFKTKNLTIRQQHPHQEYYEFQNGRMHKATIRDKSVQLAEILNTNKQTDERYLLDQANIVYKWLNSSKNLKVQWDEAET